MSETRYLVDNNALLFIGPKRRASSFFRNNCRVPEEVVHEAGTQRAELLAPITEHMTARTLMEVARVMGTVPVGDKSLINLYGNKGAADPILVATALVLNDPVEPSLFGEEWIIVTNDGGVRGKATEFGVKTVTPQAFADLVDAA